VGANVGFSEGASVATVGKCEGASDGTPVGACVGDSSLLVVGTFEGFSLGDTVGFGEGCPSEGQCFFFLTVGVSEGMTVGTPDGECEGVSSTPDVGACEVAVGLPVTAESVGATVGLKLGDDVGATVGLKVGA
jgi:hypothetical protein